MSSPQQPWTPPAGWVPTPEGWVPPSAVAPAQPLFVPSAPVPYHRLLRTVRRYAWWKPLVAIVLTFVYYVVFSLVVSAVLLGIGVAAGQIRVDTLENFSGDLLGLSQIDAASPLSITFALANLAVFLPAVQLALLSVGLRPTGVRHSVGFRIRWRWLFIALGPSALVLALSLAIGILLPGLIAGEWPLAPTTDPGLFLACAAIIVVLTPLQAAAEEYVFRGLLPQAIGAWLRWVPFALIIPSLVFARLHAYDDWGLVDVFLFGLAASIVVWRTGGLEAGIALHTLNNIASFLLLASGVFGTTVNASETAGPIGPAISLVTMTIWVLWMSWLARRAGVARVGAYEPPPGNTPDSASLHHT